MHAGRKRTHRQAGEPPLQVINVTSYTQNDIVDRGLNIGAGLTRSDIVSVLEAEKQVIGAVIPPLTAGTCQVKIIMQYTSGKLLKVPHAFAFDKPLTVA
jgi:hypothetical protein